MIWTTTVLVILLCFACVMAFVKHCRAIEAEKELEDVEMINKMQWTSTAKQQEEAASTRNRIIKDLQYSLEECRKREMAAKSQLMRLKDESEKKFEKQEEWWQQKVRTQQDQYDRALEARRQVIERMELDIKRVNECRAELAEQKNKLIEKLDHIKAIVE